MAFQKGYIPYNKGKKCPKISKGLKGRKLSEEHKQKLKEAKKKNPVRNRLGKHHTEKSKQKNREWHLNNPNRKFKDTSIELKIEAELQRRNINYQKQVPLCKIAIVDFYLPEYRIIIQCDGDYYHNLSWQKERDERQDKVLLFNGFNVYRFWEHEINKSAKNCIDKINYG